MDMSVRDLLAGSVNLAKSQALAEMARMSRKAMRLMKHDMRSLHENFPLCHKKCPLFKKMMCFFKPAAEQKECWEKTMCHLNEQVEVKCELDRPCHDGCTCCKNFRKCANLLENREDLKAKPPETKK